MTPPSFQLFGTPHIVAMAVMVAVPAALSVTVRRLDSERVTRAVVAPVNQALDANYMYLREAPDTASPFLFPPWPWYIPLLEGLAPAFFGALYLPVYLERDRAPVIGSD